MSGIQNTPDTPSSSAATGSTPQQGDMATLPTEQETRNSPGEEEADQILNFDTESWAASGLQKAEVEAKITMNDFAAPPYLSHESYMRLLGSASGVIKVTKWTDAVCFAMRKAPEDPVPDAPVPIRLDDDSGRSIVSRSYRIPAEQVKNVDFGGSIHGENLPGSEEAFFVVHDPLLADGSQHSQKKGLGLVNLGECLRLGKNMLRVHANGSSKQMGRLSDVEENWRTDFMWLVMGFTGMRLLVPRLFLSSACVNGGALVGITKLHVVELDDALIVNIQSGFRVHQVAWSLHSQVEDAQTRMLIVPPCDNSLASAVSDILGSCGRGSLGPIKVVVSNTQNEDLRCGAPFCERRGTLNVPRSAQELPQKGSAYVLNRGDTKGLSTEPGTSKWLRSLVAEGGLVGGCKANEKHPVLYSEPIIGTMEAAESPTMWRFRTDTKESTKPMSSSSTSTIAHHPPQDISLSACQTISDQRRPLQLQKARELFEFSLKPAAVDLDIQPSPGNPGNTTRQDNSHGNPLLVIDSATRQLRNLHKAEKYVAVSYTWAEYSAGENQSVIETVERTTGATAIWMDKLCVPKQEPERQRVLSAMGAIYREATLVVVMLTKMRSKLSASIRDEHQVFDWEEDRRANASFLQEYRERGWRTRVWTAQESFLSRKAIAVTTDGVTWISYLEALLANDVMGWGSVTQVGLASNDSCTVVSAQTHFTGPLAFTNTVLAGGGLQGSRGRVWSLAEAVTATTGRQCAREEDRIYGVLGLLGIKGTNVEWEYGIGWQGALLKVAKAVGISPIWLLGGSESGSPCEGFSWMPRSLAELEKRGSANVFHEESDQKSLKVKDSGVELDHPIAAGVIKAITLQKGGAVECVVRI
ncbi:uncharacterized protein FIESC28_07270 [Fusarium coffeatum]|uniref:Heterokaryon incompatibility domain-containing protein n=1 Tax=Fusarium coffeatum TaxID=231269 RepID=A0A366REN6_9HYPO|nr:uncharacterized protein FIESC28_07270 [Fusarium coffeatum]RBR15629.1 hypothetical protein FIESC28_07270 [Fusarium coffeatum]